MVGIMFGFFLAYVKNSAIRHIPLLRNIDLEFGYQSTIREDFGIRPLRNIPNLPMGRIPGFMIDA